MIGATRRARPVLSPIAQAQQRQAQKWERDAAIVRSSGFFHAGWYLSENADVARSGMDPALHWVIHGWREGRNPGFAFSTRHYLEVNPDVAASGMNPLVHYVIHGRSEGRRPAPYFWSATPQGS